MYNLPPIQRPQPTPRLPGIGPPITLPGEPAPKPEDPIFTLPIQPPGGSDPIFTLPVEPPIPPPTVNPIPPSLWDTKTTYTSPTGIKQASPDIVIFDEEIDPDFLINSFFEEFGGTELINISRHDLINGNQVSYSPIVNLGSLRQSFNPNNIIAIGAFQEIPTKYGIDLFSRGVVDPYFNDDGNLVIEIEQVRPGESLEIEIITDGTIKRIEL